MFNGKEKEKVSSRKTRVINDKAKRGKQIINREERGGGENRVVIIKNLIEIKVN